MRKMYGKVIEKGVRKYQNCNSHEKQNNDFGIYFAEVVFLNENEAGFWFTILLVKGFIIQHMFV